MFLDPRMAREGYWTWPQGGRYEGIPASNFAGWLVTGAGVFALWALLDATTTPARDGDGALCALRVDVGRRDVRQRRAVAAPARGGGRRGRHGRLRRPGAVAAMARIAVVGAGVGGLAAGIRLAALGHRVTVYEAAAAPGGKCGRVTRDGFTWDSGPSLLTMPWVLEALFADTGAPLADELELLRVEPVTRYRFADGTSVELSADPGARARRARRLARRAPAPSGRGFLAATAAMWRASEARADRAGALAAAAGRAPARPARRRSTSRA